MLIPELIYSRLSLSGSLKYGRYAGHLVWQGLLARCLLHKTCPEMRPTRYSEYWLPQTSDLHTFITTRYDDVGVVWQIKLESIHYPRDMQKQN